MSITLSALRETRDSIVFLPVMDHILANNLLFLHWTICKFQIEIRDAVDPRDHIPAHDGHTQHEPGGRDGQD